MTAQRQERTIARLAIALIAFSLALVPAHRTRAATTERIVTDRHSGVAIAGFDPVAYFVDHEARQGDAEFELSQAGVVWRFCNADNRAFFAAHPDIYAPQFGGYDPVAVARGVPLAGSAIVFLISDKRLYLFNDEASRTAFENDPEYFLREAQHQWPALLATLSE